ncbi:MAG: GlsB/YeaQ/YmgE family stress response membrane protein [Hyphomicrobiaceae bacterium]|nr:MAG: GlsB/YeaQ/YmgE family stress response membrane protein [Hyphomicrobiaceae bacterium]
MPTWEQIQPYWPFIVMGVNGLIAGWLAGLLIGGGGLIRNLIVGIIGAFVGGALVRMELLQLPVAVTNITNAIPYGTQILISTIGAIIVILIARFLGGRA